MRWSIYTNRGRHYKICRGRNSVFDSIAFWMRDVTVSFINRLQFTDELRLIDSVPDETVALSKELIGLTVVPTLGSVRVASSNVQ